MNDEYEPPILPDADLAPVVLNAAIVVVGVGLGVLLVTGVWMLLKGYNR